MLFGWLRERRRAKLRARPFPAAWRALVERNVRYVALLGDDERRELEGHVHVFLDEKSFEGCGGLELTDEIRVTIAADACLLLLGRETDYYPELASILVYPSAYRAKVTRASGAVVIEGEDARLGESHARGVVVLAWDDVLHGTRDVRDGHDVVLHEFAHQLDQEDGDADGAPILAERSMYRAWARVLGAEYERLLRDDEAGRRTVLDRYGATSPAELFAVATEAFFEKPLQMRAKHPELYAQLRGYYRQDPARRLERR